MTCTGIYLRGLYLLGDNDSKYCVTFLEKSIHTDKIIIQTNKEKIKKILLINNNMNSYYYYIYKFYMNYNIININMYNVTLYIVHFLQTLYNVYRLNTTCTLLLHYF